MLILGALMIPLGFLLHVSIPIAGLLLALGGAMLRAATPIWGQKNDDGSVSVRGFGKPFLELYQSPDQADS